MIDIKNSVLRSLAVLLLAFAGVQAHAAVPSVVMSDHQTLFAGPTGGTYGIAANARGDVFFADSGNKAIQMLAAGSSTPVALLTNVVGTPHSVIVDKAGNVYATNTVDGKVLRIPFVNGAYPTGIDVTTLASTFCTAGSTADCRLASFGTVTGNYARISDLAIDGAGNYYLVDIFDYVSNGAYTRILKQTPSGTVTVQVDNLPLVDNGEIASDAAGNLYYADGTSLYTIAAGSNTATVTNASSLSKPNGVTLDPYGNLIVSDVGNSRIVVMPFSNGKVDFTQQYLLAPYYTKNSVGIDARGTIYYTGTGSTSINSLQTSVYGVPSLAVGASSTSALVYASFNASTTFAQYLTRSYGATVTYGVNTCVIGTTYTAGQFCAFNASLKPARVGAVSGMIGIADASGNFLSQFTLSANATGSAVNIDPGTATAIGTGFTSPSGIAVDRAGNVFVADSTANTVYELVGGSGTPVALGTGLKSPSGVAVDATGNLFIADSGNARVVEIPIVGSTLAPAQQRVIVSSLALPIALATGPLNALYVAQAGALTIVENRDYAPPVQTTVVTANVVSPGALAVDGSGNIFLADQATGQVVEIDAYTHVSTTVATGFTAVTGLSLDAAGDLFVVDNGTAQTVRIPNIAGTRTQSQAVSLGTFASPRGLALDGAGNLYLSDPSIPAVYMVSRTMGRVSFGDVSQGTTSAPQSASLLSSGTQTLTLGTPLSTASGDTAHFTVTSGTTCAAGQTLAAGSACAITATFSPAVRGATSELLSLNAAPTVATSPLNVTLTGYGTYQVATSLVVAPQSSTISYGQPVTFTATLTPSTFNVANPAGTIAFTINGVQQKPVALNGTTASITVPSLAGGQNSISASYSGDLNYSTSFAQAVLVTVNQATTTAALTLAAAYSNPTSSLPGGSVTLTATLTPSVPGVLDGSVNFVSGGTTLGSATVSAISGGAYQAVLSTTTIPAGTYSITAVYAGNSNYSGSSSSSLPLIVSAASIQLTANANAITSTPVVPGSVNLSVASISGLGGSAVPVSFSCSGLPVYAQCVFNPAYISLAASPSGAPIAPQQVVLSVKVNVSAGTPQPPVTALLLGKGSGSLFAASLLFMPLLLRRLRRHRTWQTMVLSAWLPLVLLSLSGCGSGNSSVTPQGTTPITVTAFSTSATTSITLNLTVNN